MDRRQREGFTEQVCSECAIPRSNIQRARPGVLEVVGTAVGGDITAREERVISNAASDWGLTVRWEDGRGMVYETGHGDRAGGLGEPGDLDMF